MSHATSQRCPALKDGFAWYEKLGIRGGLAGVVALGAIGIYLKSPAAAIAYLVLGSVGGALVIYDFLCVYCPYPYQYSDCLFFPRQLLTMVVSRRTGKIGAVRKALLVLTAALLVLMPQYWLWGQWGLMAGFWVLAAPLGLAFPLYFCPRCRHGACAMNSGSACRTTES